MKIKCVITDDEPIARKGLRGYIEKTDFLTLTGECENALQLNELLKKEQPELLFMDIEMPYINGIDFLSGIHNPPKVIITSAYEQYALKGYELNVTDYLLKPIRRNLLFPLLDRLMLREQRPQDGLTVKNGNSLFRIPFSQLTYVEINNRHLYFNLTNGQVREVPGRMRDYEKPLLARPEFTRIHRSYIINMFQIEELTPSSVRTFTGRTLPVSRLIYPQVQKEYMNLLFSEGEAGE